MDKCDCGHEILCQNCVNCFNHGIDGPCAKCKRIFPENEKLNFECEICKKEKATGEMAKSK